MSVHPTMEEGFLNNCQETLKIVHRKRVFNKELKEDFKEKFEGIMKVLGETEAEGYKVEVESYAGVRLLQHESFDQELEEIEFKLEELNIQQEDSLLILEEELEKIGKELTGLFLKYRFTKVFFWE